MEEEILKGVKLVSGDKIPDSLMNFLKENFGGGELKGIPLERALGKEWTNFVEQYAFPKEPEKMANWQIRSGHLN